MNKISRIVCLVIGFLILVNLKLPAVKAETNSLQVDVHELIISEGQKPPEKSVGEASRNEEKLLRDYQGVNGVTVEVYDKTKQFYLLREAGKSLEEAQKQLSEEGTNGLPLMEKATETINGQKGIANFSLNKQSDGKNAVYLFHEKQWPKNIKRKSQDLVVVLPVYDQSKQVSTIHLYPKNEAVTHQVPKFSKKIMDKSDSAAYGSRISYEVTADIPVDISEYKFFRIEDQADSALSLEKAGVRLMIDGHDVSNLFTVVAGLHGYTIKATSGDVLERYANQALHISYRMTLTSREKLDTPIENTANLITDHETLERKAVIQSSGKRFRKVALEDFSKGLDDATFLVLNPQGKYLTENGKGYGWSEGRDDPKLVQLTSDKNGAFAIRGLVYENYFLKEIKAPAGYEKNAKEIPFVVAPDSYRADGTSLKIVNKLRSSTESRLPKTNERLNPFIIWLGLLLILLFILLLLLRKKTEKENEYVRKSNDEEKNSK